MKRSFLFFFDIKMAPVLLCMCVLSLQGFAQGNAAQAQPLKKTTTTTTASNTNNIKAAPWEKQRIQPAKNKPAGTTSTSTITSPAQAQPLQHK